MWTLYISGNANALTNIKYYKLYKLQVSNFPQCIANNGIECFLYQKFWNRIWIEKFSLWRKKKTFYCVFADSFEWIHMRIQKVSWHGRDLFRFASYEIGESKVKSSRWFFWVLLLSHLSPHSLSLSLYFCLLSGSVCRIVVVAHYLRLSDCWRFQADAVLWHLTLAVNDLSAWHLSSGTCSPHSTPHLPPHSPSLSLSVSLFRTARHSLVDIVLAPSCARHTCYARGRGKGRGGTDNGKIPAEQLFAHQSFWERGVWSLKEVEAGGGWERMVQKFLHQIHLVSFVV